MDWTVQVEVFIEFLVDLRRLSADQSLGKGIFDSTMLKIAISGKFLTNQKHRNHPRDAQKRVEIKLSTFYAIAVEFETIWTNRNL